MTQQPDLLDEMDNKPNVYQTTRFDSKSGVMRWAVGFNRPICRVLYGDDIPDKSLNPTWALGQKACGTTRVYAFYGDDWVENIQQSFSANGFSYQGFGKAGSHPTSFNREQGVIPRGDEASTSSLVLKVSQATFWQPIAQKVEERYYDDEITLGEGFFEFTPRRDLTLEIPHDIQQVMKPVSFKQPHTLQALAPLVESWGFRSQPHVVGLVVREGNG